MTHQRKYVIYDSKAGAYLNHDDVHDTFKLGPRAQASVYVDDEEAGEVLFHYEEKENAEGVEMHDADTGNVVGP